jgi:hypothetical protein
MHSYIMIAIAYSIVICDSSAKDDYLARIHNDALSRRLPCALRLRTDGPGCLEESSGVGRMISFNGSKTILVFRTTGRCMRMSAWISSHAWSLFAIAVAFVQKQQLLAFRSYRGGLSYRNRRGFLEFRRRDYRRVHDLRVLGFC